MKSTKRTQITQIIDNAFMKVTKFGSGTIYSDKRWGANYKRRYKATSLDNFKTANKVADQINKWLQTNRIDAVASTHKNSFYNMGGPFRAKTGRFNVVVHVSK